MPLSSFPPRRVAAPASPTPVVSLLLLTLAFVLAMAPPAGAQRGGGENAAFRATGPRLTLNDLEEIAPRLESADPNEVREALTLLSLIDRPEVVPPIAAMLRRGQPDVVTDEALLVLSQLGAPEAIDVLTEFTTHRRAAARRQAFEALGEISDRRVPALVARGLSDGDRRVRGAAAGVLGEMGPRARPEIDRRFLAFERGVVEAGPAIGKVGTEATIERFHDFLGGSIPFAVMLSGYRAYLGREDVSYEAKKGIVERLHDLATVPARNFLVEYLNTFPERPRARRIRVLRDAVEEAVNTIATEDLQ